MILLIPEENVSGGTMELVQKLIVQMSGIFLALAVVLALFMRLNARRTLEAPAGGPAGGRAGQPVQERFPLQYVP